MAGAEGSRSGFGDAPARVAVIGAGAWGTTLAAIVAQREPVTLLCHSPETAARIRDTRRNDARLPGIDLAAGIRATHDPSSLGEAVDLIVFAAPSAHLRETVERVAAHVPASADLLSVVKGIERGSHQRMSQVIADAGGFDAARIAVLSGPNLAIEIARRQPASAVVAANDVALATRIQERLGRRRFRLYANGDVLGVELCGALKLIVAIAAGDGPRAALEVPLRDPGRSGAADVRVLRHRPAVDPLLL